jgi:hypothetical protein
MTQEIDAMAKSPTQKISVEEVLHAVDSFEIEELAQLKEAVTDKISSLRHLVVQQFKDDLSRKMNLFGLTAADLGLAPSAKAPRKAGQRKMKGGACPICERETDPPHDKRAHRGGKPPFTDEDIQERGWKWVS